MQALHSMFYLIPGEAISMIADHFHFEDCKKIFAQFLHEPSIGVRSFLFASSNLFKLKPRTSNFACVRMNILLCDKQCILWIVILGIIITHIEPRTSTWCIKLLLYSSGPVQVKIQSTNLSKITTNQMIYHWLENSFMLDFFLLLVLLELVNSSVWSKVITRSEWVLRT